MMPQRTLDSDEIRSSFRIAQVEYQRQAVSYSH